MERLLLDEDKKSDLIKLCQFLSEDYRLFQQDLPKETSEEKTLMMSALNILILVLVVVRVVLIRKIDYYSLVQKEIVNMLEIVSAKILSTL